MAIRDGKRIETKCVFEFYKQGWGLTFDNQVSQRKASQLRRCCSFCQLVVSGKAKCEGIASCMGVCEILWNRTEGAQNKGTDDKRAPSSAGLLVSLGVPH